MKIDFAISSLKSGGGERVLVTLANQLANRGHDTCIITFNETVEYSLNSKITKIKLHNGFFKNQTFRYTFELLKYYRLKKNRPDALISFMTQTSLSAIIVARLYGIKVIASEHTNHLRTSTNPLIVNFTRKYIYRLAHLVTILTSFDTSFYQKNGVKSVVMPNPCSFPVNTTQTQKKDKTILAVGGLDKYHIKGFDNLLLLIAPILKEFPEWKLKIVGGGNSGLSFLKKIVTKLDISENVIFTGFSNQIPKLMQTSEIFILCSRNEGLPMALIEAMSQKMTCISYDCITGPSDILEHQKTGLLIEDQNMEEMQTQLKKLILNKSLRDELALNAVNSLDRYDINKVCDYWEDIIKKINK